MELRRGLRVSAAVFAAGVSLAGPQVATAVADNDSPDVQSAAVSQGPSGSPRAAAGRAAGPRVVAPRARESASRTARPEATAKRNSASAVFRRPALRPAGTDAGPVTAASAHATGFAAGRPVARAGGWAVQSVRSALAGAIDDVGLRWFGAPAGSPLEELLAGGLWLVRRSLVPAGADVSRWGVASCVLANSCAGRDLTGVNLSGQADLKNVDFSRANLREAMLYNADLGDTPSCAPNCQGADLSWANLEDANLNGANLTGADLSHTWMLNTSLFGANLTNANLANAAMAYVDFLGATLTGVRSGEIETPPFRRPSEYVRLPSGWQIPTGDADPGGEPLGYLVGPQANLKNANLSAAYLVNADLFAADLTGANLQYALLNNADLTFANLTNARLVGADLTSVNRSAPSPFKDGTLTNLTNADLRGAVLTNANLIQAILTGADLAKANLTDATLRNADLTGADLIGVTWSNTTCPDGSTTSTGCSSGNPVGDTVQHDNYVSFTSAMQSDGFYYFGGINSASFAPQDSTITSGQPWAGVSTSIPYFTPFNPQEKTGDLLELNAQAGRKDSSGPADWFNQQAPVFVSLAGDSSHGTTINNLNFAFTGELTLNGTTYLVALGQGNEGGGSSPWWLGGQDFTVNYPPASLPETSPVLVTPDGQYYFQPMQSDVFFVCSATSADSQCS